MRGEDVAQLKAAVTGWLNTAFPDSPRIDPDDRSGRGIHHDVTGKLLCPIKYDWDDDECVLLFFWLTVDQNVF